MNFNIRITSNFKPNDLVKDAGKYLYKDKVKADTLFADLANRGAEFMKQMIKVNSKRPATGALANAIKVVKESTGSNLAFQGEYGIGEIAVLPPYWAAVNYGSSHMVGRWLPQGQFTPGRPQPDGAYRGTSTVGISNNMVGTKKPGRWEAGAGPYWAFVSSPIPPMNYIARTEFWLERELRDLMTKLGV